MSEDTQASSSSSWERLIMSDIFTIHMAIEYLHTKKEEEIQHLVCKKLPLYPSKDLEFYLPQLICLCTTSPESYKILRDFIKDMCSKSAHFALLASWNLKAELDGTADFMKQKVIAALLHDVNMASLRLDETNPLEKVPQLLVDPDASSITYASVVATSTTLPPTPESPSRVDAVMLFPPKQSKITRQKCLEKEKEFIRKLVDVGEILRQYKDKDTRRAHLFGELSKINTTLPSRVYLPMSIIPEGDSPSSSFSNANAEGDELTNHNESGAEKDSIDSKRGDPTDEAIPSTTAIKEPRMLAQHHIVRVPPEEAVVLNSKDKAPYMLQVEVVECDDFYESVLPRKHRIRRKNLHGHKRSRSDGYTAANILSQSMLARAQSDNIITDDKDSAVMLHSGANDNEPQPEFEGTPNLRGKHSRSHSTTSEIITESDKIKHSTFTRTSITTTTTTSITYSPVAQPYSKMSHTRYPSSEGVAYTVGGSGRQSRNSQQEEILPSTPSVIPMLSSTHNSAENIVAENSKGATTSNENVNDEGNNDDGSNNDDDDDDDDDDEDEGTNGVSDCDDESNSTFGDDENGEVPNNVSGDLEREPSVTVTDIRKRLHFASSTPESKFRLSQSDPSAIKAKENWAAKVERIRSLSPYGQIPSWRLVPVIVKSGDDLRQEVLASQLLALFQWVWHKENLPLWIRPLQVLVTSINGGMLEVVGSAVSLHQTKKSAGDTLLGYFVQQFGPEASPGFLEAQDNFVRSLAAYSLFTYFAQVKDRHNGNILIDSKGHLLHIDFGFFLSNSPGGNFGFETAPFKLLKDFIEVMGGNDGKVFQHFKELLFQGFLAARKHKDTLVTLIEIMAEGTDYPCFTKKKAVAEFDARFCRGKTDAALRSHVEELIKKSSGNTRTKLYDNFQYFTNGILQELDATLQLILRLMENFAKKCLILLDNDFHYTF